MFGHKVEKAKSNWPTDRINTKKGQVTITGDYRSPRHGQNVALLTSASFLPPLLLFGPIAALAFAFVALLFFWWVMKKNLNVKISPTEIRVNGKRYDRQQSIEFRAGNHHKALRHNPGIYATAIEVVMQYGERRIPIAEMRLRDKHKAVALVVRLQNWCDSFDEAMRQAQAMKQDMAPAAGEFGPAPDVR